MSEQESQGDYTTSSKYEIRPLSSEEELILLEQHIDFDWASSKKHRKRFDRQQEGHAVYLVAWDEGLPVGHAFVKWDGSSDQPIASKVGRCADIEDLFVRHDWRSKGVGSQMLDRASTLAKREGYSRIGLGVDVDNPRARSLYERKGFADSGLGEYRTKWPWTDKDGQERWAEENCHYLIRELG